MTNRAKKMMIVKSTDEWNELASDVSFVRVDSGVGNTPSLIVLNMSRFVNLQELSIGNGCFENVKELKLIGMNMLERVVIGENSFTKEKNSWGDDSERHFYLKNCPKVKELRVGRYSFSDYSVIEIENVNRLEVVEIGELSDVSYNFYSASLRLRSMNGMMK